MNEHLFTEYKFERWNAEWLVSSLKWLCFVLSQKSGFILVMFVIFIHCMTFIYVCVCLFIYFTSGYALTFC